MKKQVLERDRIIEMCQIGEMNASQIADELGLSYCTVRRILRAEGLLTAGRPRGLTTEWLRYKHRLERQYSKETTMEIENLFTVARTFLTAKKNAGWDSRVVMDIDETTLDNRVYNEQLIATRTPFPGGWIEWQASMKAVAIPAAKRFVEWCLKSDIEIFFVSSRPPELHEKTAENLIQNVSASISRNRVYCKGDSKWEAISAAAPTLLLDDKVSPIPLFLTTCLIVPNYLYGAHASAFKE